MWGIIPYEDGLFGDPELEPSELDNGPLMECLATCHSLTLIEGVLCGDPLDLKMFQSTKWVRIVDGSSFFLLTIFHSLKPKCRRYFEVVVRFAHHNM